MADLMPHFVPTEAGADEVIRAARARRRGQVMVTGGALATVAVVLLTTAALRPGDATQRLGVADGSRPATSSAPSATTAPTPAAGAPVAKPSTGASAGGTAGPGSAAAAPSAVVPASPAASTLAPPGAGGSTTRRSPIERRTATIAATDICQEDSADAGQGWCVRILGPDTARRGSNVTFSAELCRLASFPAAQVQFSSTREISMTVSGPDTRTDDRIVWAAGEGIAYRSPGGSVTMRSGTCLVWSSTWDTRDRDGFLVPPSSYTLTFGVDATSPRTSSFGTTVTVTD